MNLNRTNENFRVGSGGENILVYKGINFLYVSVFGIIFVAFAVLLLMWGETRWTLIILGFYTLLVIYMVIQSYRRGILRI
jgi:hypothetical protein